MRLFSNIKLIFKKSILLCVSSLLNIFVVLKMEFSGKFPTKLVIGKVFGFATNLGHSEILFYLENYQVFLQKSCS